MTGVEILKELSKMTPSERLEIVESILRSIRSDLQEHTAESFHVPTGKKKQLAIAAEALLADYGAGGELTAFTALDGEDFHAQR